MINRCGHITLAEGELRGGKVGGVQPELVDGLDGLDEIDYIIVETMDRDGPFGAKGIGEPGCIRTAAAIANAIYDAIGIRFYDLPITPEKIFKALREREGHKTG